MDWEKRILFDPDTPGEEGGGDDAGAGAGEGGETKPSGAVDTKDVPAPPKFDASSVVPTGVLPNELKMYEGKTWTDVFTGVGEMRKTLTESQTKNVELSEQLKKASATPEGAEEARQAAMVTTDEYVQIQNNFYETGEVPQDFLEAVANQGAKVAPEELLAFFQWKKVNREAMLSAGGEAAPEGVDFNDLLGWMQAGDSGFSKEERAGFQKMSDRGNYSWVTMVAEDYKKAIEANTHRPNLRGNRFMGGEARQGKPALGGDQDGFKDTAEFAEALRKVANDPNLDPAQRTVRRNAVIAERARQRGDKVTGMVR